MSTQIVDCREGINKNERSIWHLESSEWKQLSLPATGVQYFAHGDMVAVKTAQGVVVWTWGGKVTEFEVNTPQLGDLPVGCEGAHSEWTLLFHPTRSDTLFSVRTYCHNESGMRSCLQDCQSRIAYRKNMTKTSRRPTTNPYCSPDCRQTHLRRHGMAEAATQNTHSASWL